MPLESALTALIFVAKAMGLGVLLIIFVGLDLHKRWRMRHLPGPPALPFLGNLPQVIKMGSPAFFRQCRQKYGPVFKVAFGRTWMVVVADPDLMRQAGTKLLNHSLFRTLMRGEFAKLDDWGLLSAKDDYWRTVRSSWQPAFSAASLAGYLPRMLDAANKLVDRLEARARGAPGAEGAGPAADVPPARVDIWRELGSMTLQVVGSTAYGVDFRAMEVEEPGAARAEGAALGGGGADGSGEGEAIGTRGQYGSVLVQACRDVFRYSSIVYGSKYSRVSLLLPELRPLVSRLAYALPDQPFARLLKARRNLRDACMDLIASSPRGSTSETAVTTGKATRGMAAAATTAAEEAAAETDMAYGTAAGAGGRAPTVAPGSFLGLMLSARDKATGEGLTDLQVAAQVQTFILAGYETTANALAFAVYCIARHLDVEAEMVAEIESVLGSGRAPTEADLPLLPYTEAVFNEAMRLYPPAHATNRHSDKKPFQVGGYTVPTDVPVFLSIFSSHHNLDIWPRSEEFIPERFLPTSPLYPEVCARVPGAHAPFGFGSRMCIGWKFAVQEAKVTLARLYQRLTFELEPGQVPLRTAIGITMSPREGVWVRPKLRLQTLRQRQ